MQNEYKKQLVEYSHLIESKGFVNALEGNISVIDRSTGEIYITPSGTRKLTLTDDQVAIVDKEGNQIAGSRNHSKEIILHRAAYDLRPDCNAAIHCHSTFLTAYAFCNKSIKIDSDIGFASVFGEIPCVPFGMPASAEITKDLPQYLIDNDIVLLANHGVMAVGKDLETCFKLLEAAEGMVKTAYIASQIGAPESLPNNILEKVRKKPINFKK